MPEKTSTVEPLTEYAQDQLRRLREHCERFPNDRDSMCVTASGRGTLPPIWAGLEESGHVIVKWSGEGKDAHVKPMPT